MHEKSKKKLIFSFTRRHNLGSNNHADFEANQPKKLTVVPGANAEYTANNNDSISLKAVYYHTAVNTVY